jgi:hypothetical protein
MTDIKRYFSDAVFDEVKGDLSFLVKTVNDSDGELDFQIRPNNKINIYYKGNSLAELTCGRGNYRIKVHNKFGLRKALEDDPAKRFDNHDIKRVGDYDTVLVESQLIHPCLQKKVLTSLMGKIKEVNNGEEIGFEQSLMTDNLYRPEYIIIDRQVGGGGMPGMLDLLALRRESEGKYHLEAVEVKLGNNKELNKAVFSQIDRYVQAIEKNFDAFKRCYELNYTQKRALGLFPTDWEPSIEIVQDVKGLIVVGSYFQIGEKAIEKLHQHHPDMPYQVRQFRNTI